MQSSSSLTRIRRPCGEHKQTCERAPTVVADVKALIDPDTRGNPMSPVYCTCKTMRQISPWTVAGEGLVHRVVANCGRERYHGAVRRQGLGQPTKREIVNENL